MTSELPEATGEDPVDELNRWAWAMTWGTYGLPYQAPPEGRADG